MATCRTVQPREAARRGACRGIAWDDPRVGVEWPIGDPILSERDRSNPRLADVPHEELGADRR